MCELHTNFLEPASDLKGIQLFVFLFNRHPTREHPYSSPMGDLMGMVAFSPAPGHTCSSVF